MSRLVPQMALQVANNEAFQRTFALKDENGEPFNLTGWSFLAQVKATRSRTATALADMAASIEGDATLGVLTLALTRTQMEAIAPGSYFYDVLAENGTGKVSNLWISEFNVAPGVTQWSSP